MISNVLNKPVSPSRRLKTHYKKPSLAISYITITVVLALGWSGISCNTKKGDDTTTLAPAQSPTPTPEPPRYLYLASGACYGGGVTTSTGAGTVARYNLSTGNWDSIVIDYNASSPGDLPVRMVNYDNDHLLIAVENASGRRIDLVKKDGSGFVTYISNSTALSAVIRDLFMLSDGSLLVSKSSAIEKFNSSKSRITIGANPFVSAPAGSCATSTTLISSVIALSSGKLLFAHAAATPNNKLGLIASTGYSVAGDCLAGKTAPNTTAMPTAMLAHSNGNLLVAYGSTTVASNFIYSYSFDNASNSIANDTASFNDFSVIYGPSAMVEDTETGDLFVANANNTYNNVERFTYNPSTKAMQKVGSSPFVSQSVFTRCISGLLISN